MERTGENEKVEKQNGAKDQICQRKQGGKEERVIRIRVEWRQAWSVGEIEMGTKVEREGDWVEEASRRYGGYDSQKDS